MNHLDRKLLRDLRGLKSQALAVALVMACGLAMMIMTRSLIRSLETAQAGYYEANRFAQVFAGLKRAPLSVVERIAEIPGVGAVETGIGMRVTLDLPGMAEPASALINSLPDRAEARLNRLYLRSGHMIGMDSRHQILVGEAFADAHGLKPGDALSAILNGRKIPLRIAGIVLSPEYVFEAPPGAALPDNRTFGVFWMRYEELAEAYSLEGAFNRVSVTLAPGASERAVIAEMDRVLEAFGGLGAYGRENHPSHIRVRDEIRVLEGLSFGFPIVFLSVAAFMTNSVMSRQIALQREQIAILKAFGFSNAQIGGHFFKFTFAIIAAGTVLGALGGVVLGHKLVDMYHLFFRFPRLEFMLSWPTLVAAVGASAVASSVGVVGAVRRAVLLPPAEAMRPEAPASFRPSLAERAGIGGWFSASMRMAMRNVERKPWRAGLTVVALALATGILIIPNSFRDGVGYILDFQWDLVHRETVSLSLVEPGPARAIAEFRQLPGVVHAEPFRYVAVELDAGTVRRRVAIQGLPSEGVLSRVVDGSGVALKLPERGLVLSRKLGEALGLRVGDAIVVRVLEGKRPVREVTVAGYAEDFAGIAAYMELDALNRLLMEGDRISGAHVSVAAGSWREFLTEVKNTPRASGVVIKDSMRESFRKTTAQSIGLLQTIYLVFATVVAFGIVYNSARISLSERQRELATLRVLGFTRREVGAVLVGELVILAVVAIPLGLVFGSGMAKAILTSVNTETVRLPLILTPANYAFATLVIVVATTLSLVFACRKLAQLDLVAVLKARD